MSDEQQHATQGEGHQQAPDQREWIPVPPPHPYAAPASPTPKNGKLLAILAMVLGLVAVLTVFVAAGYLSPAVVAIGGVLGLAAIVVGIIALVKRARPLGAAIAGTAAGVLSLFGVVALAATGIIANSINMLTGPERGPESTEWSPDAEQESLVSWPANMASGGIIFEGPGDPRPVNSDPLVAGTSPQPNEVNRGARNDVLVYVDYSCPHCMAFEQSNSELLAQVIADGSTTVEIVPLSFLDRNSPSNYSSRAAGAVACLADSQPEAAWAGHQVLLTPEVQPSGTDGAANDQLVEILDAAVGGLTGAARECISTERFVTFAQALNSWVFANPIPNTIESALRVEGTPTVLVNGVLYQGAPEDAGAFQAFFEEQSN